MPELPEVETTVRALTARIRLPATLAQVVVRNPLLRRPVPAAVGRIKHEPLVAIGRRAKYILLHLASGDLLIHLGMSGRLLIVDDVHKEAAIDKHTHAILTLHHHTEAGATTSHVLFRDPRRFGLLGFQLHGQAHDALGRLGVEPLSDDWTGDYLHTVCRKRRMAIKDLIMQQRTVVGIGNIYAAETLFRAGVRPFVVANTISKRRAQLIVQHSKEVLQEAIVAGGTSLKDFYSPDNKQGYFAQKLFVYGRADAPCLVCKTPIVRAVRGARSAFYCPTCQRG